MADLRRFVQGELVMIFGLATIDKEDPRVKHVVSNTGEAWYYDDKLHRLEGPAVSYMVGLSIIDDSIIEDHEWWYHGNKIECSSQEEFERIIKMKAFW